MKYISVFHTVSLNIIEINEMMDHRPEFMENDFITLEKGEAYKVLAVRFNHDVYNNRIFVYVTCEELNEEEQHIIDSLITN